MFAAYYDASGIDELSRRIVLAGFVAPIEKWVEFESDWKALLSEPRYALEYAHAKKIAQWKEEKRTRFYLEVNYLLKRTISFAQSVVVKKDDYRRIFPDNTVSNRDSAYGFCFRGALVAVSMHLEESWPTETAALFLESGDPNQGGAIEIFNRHKKEISESEVLRKRYPIETLTIAEKKSWGALQVADLHAYSRLRDYEPSRRGTKSDIDKLLSNLDVSNFEITLNDLRGHRIAAITVPRLNREAAIKRQQAYKAKRAS